MNTPIDPLFDFRADGYGLDPERRARMRARVLDAIPDAPATATLVAEPLAPSVMPAPIAVLRDESDALILELDRGAPRGVADRSAGRTAAARPQWSSGRRLLAAAAVAVVIGLLAVVAGVSRSSDRQVGTLDESSPDVTLEDLARIAVAQPDRALAVGEYQFLESTQADRHDDGSLELLIDKNWHTRDSSGHRQSATMVRPAGALPGAEIDRTATQFGDDPAGIEWFGGFTYEGLRNAPTDPEALIDAITAASTGQRNQDIAEQIVLIESLTVTPPQVRAAGLRALAILGYHSIGSVTDPQGLSAVGFRSDVADGTEVLAFDPTTGRGLGFWSGSDHDATTPDAAVKWRTYAHGDVTGQPG